MNKNISDLNSYPFKIVHNSWEDGVLDEKDYDRRKRSFEKKSKLKLNFKNSLEIFLTFLNYYDRELSIKDLICYLSPEEAKVKKVPHLIIKCEKCNLINYKNVSRYSDLLQNNSSQDLNLISILKGEHSYLSISKIKESKCKCKNRLIKIKNKRIINLKSPKIVSRLVVDEEYFKSRHTYYRNTLKKLEKINLILRNNDTYTFNKEGFLNYFIEEDLIKYSDEDSLKTFYILKNYILRNTRDRFNSIDEIYGDIISNFSEVETKNIKNKLLVSMIDYFENLRYIENFVKVNPESIIKKFS